MESLNFFSQCKPLFRYKLRNKGKKFLKIVVIIFGAYIKSDYFCTRFKTERRLLNKAQEERSLTRLIHKKQKI